MCTVYKIKNDLGEEVELVKKKELDKVLKCNQKALNIINKFKETYIICFDKELWGFIERLSSALKGSKEE